MRAQKGGLGLRQAPWEDLVDTATKVVTLAWLELCNVFDGVNADGY